MLNREGLKIIILSFLMFAINASISSQVAYHNFNSNDGLPSNEVYCVHQDHQGFLWFGTDHGVVKYNGYNFKTFTTADGLTDNTVLSMKEDDSGNVWFLTLTGGMCFFDGAKFAPHPFNDTIKKLCNNAIPTSYEIIGNKQIWLGFVEKGIAKIDTDRATFYYSKGTPVKVNDSIEVSVFRLSNQRYIYTSFQTQELRAVPDTLIKACNTYKIGVVYGRLNFNLLTLPDKEVVIGLENYLLRIDSNKRAWQYVLPRNNPILNIQQGSDKKLWVLEKNNSSYLIQLNDGEFTKVDSFSFVSSASNLMLDDQGNQWITTLNQGIYMVPNKSISVFSNLKLPNHYKLSCINSNSKKLYVGLPEGRLLKIDNQFNATISAIGRGNGPSAIASITFKLNGEPQPNLDTTFNWFQKIDRYYTKILQLDEQNYLVGMPGGFALLNRNKKILFSSQQSGLSKRVSELSKLLPGKFIIGTFTGLYYYEPEKNNLLTEEPHFKNMRIAAVKVLNTWLYGVATRGNGVVLSIKNNFHNIGEQQGLVSNLAEDLYFENDSVLWVASFKGISKVYFHITKNSLTTRIKNYTREDGLCSNQVNGITGFNGFIWLATNEGLCYFRPQDLTEDTIQIPLFLGNISVNGQAHATDSMVLSHDENNIYIEFNALYYKAIQGIRYKMRLNGTGPWKYTDLNYVQYYSLPPGRYQFEVAAEDKDGKYRSDVHTLKFTIKPRFTDTMTFRLILGLIILLIASAIISSIFGYQKLKATNVIKLLQAEFKALNYQINPHFIFNVLNSIQYYILKKDTKNAVHLLSSFSLLIRRIVNNSRQQYIGIIEEVECLREYLDLEKMRLDNKFEYTINIGSSINVQDKNILPMIIQPLVENSIWHGIVPSSKPGIIRIDFNKENGAVVCKVDDNGVGINAAEEKKEKNQNNLSMAMENVRERLKIIGELNDSSWAIKTEDKSVSDPTATGTIVTIVFPSIKSRA